jgi:hypothetical protein
MVPQDLRDSKEVADEGRGNFVLAIQLNKRILVK